MAIPLPNRTVRQSDIDTLFVQEQHPREKTVSLSDINEMFSRQKKTVSLSDIDAMFSPQAIQGPIQPPEFDTVPAAVTKVEPIVLPEKPEERKRAGLGVPSYVEPGKEIYERAPSLEEPEKKVGVFQMPEVEVTAPRREARLTPEEQARVSPMQLEQYRREAPPSITEPTTESELAYESYRQELEKSLGRKLPEAKNLAEAEKVLAQMGSRDRWLLAAPLYSEVAKRAPFIGGIFAGIEESAKAATEPDVLSKALKFVKGTGEAALGVVIAHAAASPLIQGFELSAQTQMDIGEPVREVGKTVGEKSAEALGFSSRAKELSGELGGMITELGTWILLAKAPSLFGRIKSGKATPQEIKQAVEEIRKTNAEEIRQIKDEKLRKKVEEVAQQMEEVTRIGIRTEEQRAREGIIPRPAEEKIPQIAAEIQPPRIETPVTEPQVQKKRLTEEAIETGQTFNLDQARARWEERKGIEKQAIERGEPKSREQADALMKLGLESQRAREEVEGFIAEQRRILKSKMTGKEEPLEHKAYTRGQIEEKLNEIAKWQRVKQYPGRLPPEQELARLEPLPPEVTLEKPSAEVPAKDKYAPVRDLIEENARKDPERFPVNIGERLFDDIQKAIEQKDYARLRDMVHPMNPVWRAYFQRITGKQLPQTVGGSETAAKEIVGTGGMETFEAARKAGEERRAGEHIQFIANRLSQQGYRNPDGTTITAKERIDQAIASGQTELTSHQRGATKQYFLTRPGEGSGPVIVGADQIEYARATTKKVTPEKPVSPIGEQGRITGTKPEKYKNARDFAETLVGRLGQYSKLTSGYANEGFELFDENRFFDRLGREFKLTREEIKSIFPVERTEPVFEGSGGLMKRPSKEDLAEFYNRAIKEKPSPAPKPPEMMTREQSDFLEAYPELVDIVKRAKVKQADMLANPIYEKAEEIEGTSRAGFGLKLSTIFGKQKPLQNFIDLAEKYGKKVEVPEEKGVAGILGRPEKFRQLADQMQGQIDERRREMTQNPTPKRMKEYRSRVIEGDDLERAQQALRTLADAHERGTVPPILRELKSKSEVLPLVRKGTTGGGGYYDVIASMEYKDTSPQGKALQDLMEAKPELRVADVEKQKAQKLAQMEAEVQFRPLPGFFPTPKPLVRKMIEAADIEEGQKILEPSAGKGDILDVLKEEKPEATDVKAVELMSPLVNILEAKGYDVTSKDFLEYKEPADKILMNPPFEKGQDIDHVRHAYDLLNPGGRVVAIVSEGSFSRSDKKATGFREWLDEVDGRSEKIERGAFTGKEAFRQTGVASRMVVIDKPAEAKPEIAPIREEAVAGLPQLKTAEEIPTLEPMKPPRGPGKQPTEIKTPQPEGRKFKNWFADSKIVDKSGNPLVVYHGTGADVKSFDPRFQGLGTQSELAQKGIFFTNSKAAAQTYADRAPSREFLESLPGSKKVSEVQYALQDQMSKELSDYHDSFLKTHKITEHQLSENEVLYKKYSEAYDKIGQKYETQIHALQDDFFKVHPKREAVAVPRIVSAHLRIRQPEIIDARGAVITDIEIESIVDKALRDKRDGVVIRNVIDVFGEESLVSDVYIAFSPEQVRIISPNLSRAPEGGAQVVPALKPTEVPSEKPLRPTGTEGKKLAMELLPTAAYLSVDALPVDDDTKEKLKIAFGALAIAGLGLAASKRVKDLSKEFRNAAFSRAMRGEIKPTELEADVRKRVTDFFKSEESKSLSIEEKKELIRAHGMEPFRAEAKRAATEINKALSEEVPVPEHQKGSLSSQIAAKNEKTERKKPLASRINQKIAEYRLDAQRDGLRGIELVDYVRGRVNEYVKTEKPTGFTEKQREMIGRKTGTLELKNAIKRLQETEQRTQRIAQARDRAADIAIETQRRLINNYAKPEEAKKIITRVDELADHFRDILPESNYKTLKGGLMSRNAVFTRDFGPAGAELQLLFLDGNIKERTLRDVFIDQVSQHREIFEEINRNKSSLAKKVEIGREVKDALNDREHAQTYLTSETARQVYETYKDVFDKAETLIRAKGYTVEDNYFPRLKQAKSFEQRMEELENLTGQDFHKARQMNAPIKGIVSEKSPRLKERTAEEEQFPTRFDVENILPQYLNSIIRELSYGDAMKYLKNDFTHLIPEPLFQRAPFQRVADLVKGNLRPDVGRGFFWKAESYISNNIIQSAVEFSLNNNVMNLTQTDFTRLYMGPEGTRLANQIWKQRKTLTGKLKDAIQIASEEESPYIERSPAELKRRKILQRSVEKYGPQRMGERHNWRWSELGLIVDSAVKNPKFSEIYKRVNDPVKAMNELFEKDQTAYQTAIRNAQVLTMKTQVSQDIAARPEYWDTRAIKMFLRLKSFKFRAIEVVAEAFKKQEGAYGVRNQTIWSRGVFSEATKPGEVLLQIEDYRARVDRILKDPDAVKLLDVKSKQTISDFRDYLGGQERELNAIIKQMEPLSMNPKSEIGRIRTFKILAKYYPKIVMTSILTTYLSNLIDNVVGTPDQDEDKLHAYAVQRMFLDLNPSPFYGVNPLEWLKPIIIPGRWVAKYGLSKRTIVHDAVQYGIAGLIPFGGMVDRWAGGIATKTITNLIVPPKKKLGTAPPIMGKRNAIEQLSGLAK